MLLLVILTFAMNYKDTAAISLYCRFEMVHPMGIYSCSATVLIETQNRQDVTAIFGTHETGKGNEDVTGLTINSQHLAFFPTKIEEFLPNIEAISFHNNSIRSVNNENLSPFTNLWHLDLSRNRISELDKKLFNGLNSLRELYLSNNDITSIDSNLFAGLSARILVELSHNKIRHVGHDLFVPENSNIWLRNNSCVDTSLSAHHDEEMVNEFKFSLLLNCPPKISLIESTLESRQNFIQKLVDRIAALEKIIER